MNTALDLLFAAGQVAAVLHLAWGAYLCLRRPLASVTEGLSPAQRDRPYGMA